MGSADEERVELSLVDSRQRFGVSLTLAARKRLCPTVPGVPRLPNRKRSNVNSFQWRETKVRLATVLQGWTHSLLFSRV